MSITGLGTTNPLLKQLETNGLTAAKAKIVADDVAASSKSGLATGAATPITPAVRAAIDTKIQSDVLSGKLSQSDAAAAKKTLDEVQAQTADATPATTEATAAAAETSGGGTSGGGGGGGGGSAAKTELSETVTVSGTTKTTVITYTDDTTATTTATATAADEAKYGKPGAADTGSAAKEYATTIEPGLLVDQIA